MQNQVWIQRQIDESFKMIERLARIHLKIIKQSTNLSEITAKLLMHERVFQGFPWNLQHDFENSMNSEDSCLCKQFPRNLQPWELFNDNHLQEQGYHVIRLKFACGVEQNDLLIRTKCSLVFDFTKRK